VDEWFGTTIFFGALEGEKPLYELFPARFDDGPKHMAGLAEIDERGGVKLWNHLVHDFAGHGAQPI
jgi:hypothetical protein